MLEVVHSYGFIKCPVHRSGRGFKTYPARRHVRPPLYISCCGRRVSLPTPRRVNAKTPIPSRCHFEVYTRSETSHNTYLLPTQYGMRDIWSIFKIAPRVLYVVLSVSGSNWKVQAMRTDRMAREKLPVFTRCFLQEVG